MELNMQEDLLYQMFQVAIHSVEIILKEYQ